MTRTADITFRNHIVSVVIEFDSGYDRDTGSHEIIWHFEDVSPEEHDALEITDA